MLGSVQSRTTALPNSGQSRSGRLSGEGRQTQETSTMQRHNVRDIRLSVPQCVILLISTHAYACRYELMLKCWEERADNRPTFAVIVSQYHNGLIPGTAKTEEGDGYILLGSEEMNSTTNQHEQRDSEEKRLSNTSVMDITIVNDHCEDPASPSVGGTTFNVTLLCGPKGSDEPGVIAAQLDKEEYVEMSAAVSNVLVNPAAHEHDGVSDDEGSHVTSSADHVISDMDGVTPVEHELNYVIIQEADPINQK